MKKSLSQQRVAAIGDFICPTLEKERRVETIEAATALIDNDARCFFCGQLPTDCNFGIIPR